LREPSQAEEAKLQPKVGLKQLLEVFLVCSLPGPDFEITHPTGFPRYISFE